MKSLSEMVYGMLSFYCYIAGLLTTLDISEIHFTVLGLVMCNWLWTCRFCIYHLAVAFFDFRRDVNTHTQKVSLMYVGLLARLSTVPLCLLFRNCWRICFCRVTIVKDKDTRRSKGVAFILFLQPDEAWTAVRAVNETTVSIKLADI